MEERTPVEKNKIKQKLQLWIYWSNSFVHSLNKYLLRTSSILCVMQGSGDRMMTKSISCNRTILYG